jgi:Tol biopolymer transport system component
MPVENGETICLQERGGSLTWSPNGERIAFTNSLGIRAVDTQTGIVQTLVDLVNDEKGAFYLDWSPDGKYLACQKCYHPESNQSCDVYVVSSDGKESRRLTRNRFADEFPVWQPIVPTTD